MARQATNHANYTNGERTDFYQEATEHWDYFVPKIASLAALATRNLTTRFALIWMVSPVAAL